LTIKSPKRDTDNGSIVAWADGSTKAIEAATTKVLGRIDFQKLGLIMEFLQGLENWFYTWKSTA
jgi:hypothetical protein